MGLKCCEVVLVSFNVQCCPVSLDRATVAGPGGRKPQRPGLDGQVPQPKAVGVQMGGLPPTTCYLAERSSQKKGEDTINNVDESQVQVLESRVHGGSWLGVSLQPLSHASEADTGESALGRGV